MAEIERNLISMRTKEALALRKAEGMVLGRKKGSFTKQKVLIDNQEEIVRMLEGAGYRDIAVHRDLFDKPRMICCRLK